MRLVGRGVPAGVAACTMVSASVATCHPGSVRRRSALRAPPPPAPRLTDPGIDAVTSLARRSTCSQREIRASSFSRSPRYSSRSHSESEAQEVVVHLARPLVAIARVACERAQDDLLEPLGNAGVERARRSDLGRADLLQHRDVAVAGEELLPAEHLPEKDAGGEDVAAVIDGVALHLLGAHVAELALEDARLRLREAALRLGDAEVDELHVSVEGDEDVLRRDVAMDDAERHAVAVALAVRVIERLANAGEDEAGLRDRHRTADLAEALVELPHVAPGDVLHGDEVAVLVLAELDHLHDVRVRQLRGDARLVDEHLDELGVLAHGGEDPLDGEQALEPSGAEGLGRIDLGHPAHGDALQQQILAELDGLSHRDADCCFP